MKKRMRETSKLILLRNVQKTAERIIREEGYEADSVILNHDSAGCVMFHIKKDGKRIGGANYYLKNGVCGATYTRNNKEQHYIIRKILNETAMLRFYYKRKFTKEDLKDLGVT